MTADRVPTPAPESGEPPDDAELARHLARAYVVAVSESEDSWLAVARMAKAWLVAPPPPGSPPGGQVKLSARQYEALSLMADGWEASWSGGRDSGAGLQRGKIGYGGESRPLHASTLHALATRGLVKRLRSCGIGCTAYGITDKGREAQGRHRAFR